MTVRFLFLCFSLLCLSGCSSSSSSNPATYSSVPVDTELQIYGVTDGSVMSRNCIYATIDRSKSSVFRHYTGIVYTLDTQLNDNYSPPVYFGGKDTIQITIPVARSGQHQFVVKGIMTNKPGIVDLEPGRKFSFNVDYQLDNAGAGKYAGDRTVYDAVPAGGFANMRVEFVTYSASKSARNLANGGMRFTNLKGGTADYAGSINIAAANNSDQPYVTVDYLMNSAAGYVRTVGPAFNHFMELLLLQGPTGGIATQEGDLRLYRNDPASKVVGAYCSSLKGYRSTQEMETSIILHSFDNINFFGHLRLWNKGGDKVWTYQVAAYASPRGLSVTDNNLVLWASIPTSPLDDFLLGVNTYPNQYSLTNPAGAKPSQTPGFMTVSLDSAGKFKIDQLNLKLDDIYDAAAGSIQMKMSYKP